MWQNEDKLIRNLFLESLLTFFLSMLTTSLGTLVDGLVIGNTMTTGSVAAFQIINPLNFMFAIIGSVLNSGCTNACSKALGQNDATKARAVFSATNIFGVGLSIIVALVILVLADPILIFLGAEQETEVFFNAKDYLIGYLFGLPAITATKLLASIMQLDSDRPRAIAATAVMTVVNIAGDLLCVFVFHTGLAAIAAVTTISYYAGAAVLILHFVKKDIIFKFSLRSPDWNTLKNICFKGMPKGVSRITSSVRGIFMNKMATGIAATCVAGLAVSFNVNYLVNAVVMGIASTFMILISVYYGAENRRALKVIIKVACICEIAFTGTLSVLLFVLAPQISRLYLGHNIDAIPYGITCLRWYAAGLLFQGFNILFADYLQATGRIGEANIIYVIEDVAVTIGAGLLLSGRFLADGIYMSVAVSQILTFVLIPVFVFISNRVHKRSAGDFLMLGSDFGSAPGDEFLVTITSMEGVIKASENLLKFCLGKGLSKRKANAIALASEEMVSNIISKGFSDGKPHYIDLRGRYEKDGGMTLIIRDDTKLYNPLSRLEYIKSNDPTTNIGLRITMNLAKDVNYTSTLKLNNLEIRL